MRALTALMLAALPAHGPPLPPGVAARVDVPAALLRPDDYFVIAAAQRYFLSVRTSAR